MEDRIFFRGELERICRLRAGSQQQRENYWSVVPWGMGWLDSGEGGEEGSWEGGSGERGLKLAANSLLCIPSFPCPARF